MYITHPDLPLPVEHDVTNHPHASFKWCYDSDMSSAVIFIFLSYLWRGTWRGLLLTTWHPTCHFYHSWRGLSRCQSHDDTCPLIIGTRTTYDTIPYGYVFIILRYISQAYWVAEAPDLTSSVVLPYLRIQDSSPLCHSPLKDIPYQASIVDT